MASSKKTRERIRLERAAKRHVLGCRIVEKMTADPECCTAKDLTAALMGCEDESCIQYVRNALVELRGRGILKSFDSTSRGKKKIWYLSIRKKPEIKKPKAVKGGGWDKSKIAIDKEDLEWMEMARKARGEKMARIARV